MTVCVCGHAFFIHTDDGRGCLAGSAQMIDSTRYRVAMPACSCGRFVARLTGAEIRQRQEERERRTENARVRDLLVLQFGAMIYAAAITQAVIERNWTAIVWGVASLFATWIGWRLLTR